ncbi:MAG: hypothetical protein ACK587_13625 [Cyanobacteriota bacterium]
MGQPLHHPLTQLAFQAFQRIGEPEHGDANGPNQGKDVHLVALLSQGLGAACEPHHGEQIAENPAESGPGASLITPEFRRPPESASSEAAT